MTEQEARNSICWRTYTAHGGSANTLNCLASECMAWRWMYALNQELTAKQNADLEHMQGYCGLAGNPRRDA